jgi:hypothetical protein
MTGFEDFARVFARVFSFMKVYLPGFGRFFPLCARFLTIFARFGREGPGNSGRDPAIRFTILMLQCIFNFQNSEKRK